MPYRRLPNTDISRIKALKTAINKASDTDFREVAFSMKTLSDARLVVDRFERLCKRYQHTFDTQVKANIAFQAKVKNFRLYISHFIQVLHMSVLRDEIKTEHLSFYNLDDKNLVLPELNSNDQLLEWGEKIIKGEKLRQNNGGVPIYNPSIAKVNVMYNIFKEGYFTQKIHQKATNRVLQEVSDFRSEVDKIILNIWDEVEKFNSKFTSKQSLEKNKEYGLVYYYRKSEITE